MTDHSTLSDERLWQMASSGDETAEAALVERYIRLVKICARPLFLAGGDGEDLIQEGLLGLLSAVRRFESERDASFRTFAEHCIRNRLYTAVRTAARSKHGPLNDSVPFDAAAVGERLEQRDPEELILSRERVSEIEGAARSMLSGLEAEVLELYLQGCSYQEIAEQTGRAPKSVDNAVQRLRKKLSAYLSRR